ARVLVDEPIQPLISKLCLAFSATRVFLRAHLRYRISRPLQSVTDRLRTEYPWTTASAHGAPHRRRGTRGHSPNTTDPQRTWDAAGSGKRQKRPSRMPVATDPAASTSPPVPPAAERR